MQVTGQSGESDCKPAYYPALKEVAIVVPKENMETAEFVGKVL